MRNKIESALISCYYKEYLEDLVEYLNELGVRLYASGGTAEFIRSLDILVEEVEDLTGFPSILGGRVKTLHPYVFGGILADRDKEDHLATIEEYEIPLFDLVVVDLYPFEELVLDRASHSEILEKIDIGGVSLIRAAAKNYKHVAVVPSHKLIPQALEWLKAQGGSLTEWQRLWLATESFKITSHYDEVIHRYFEHTFLHKDVIPSNHSPSKMTLRYGENPHQLGEFLGQLSDILTQFSGKELSYNNLLDIDSAMHLLHDLILLDNEGYWCGIIKHTNPCGVAKGDSVLNAFERALACDPVSAFGGIIIVNQPVDRSLAERLKDFFYEVLIAPDYEAEALTLLKQNQKRILLKYHTITFPEWEERSVLNGKLRQTKNQHITHLNQYRFVTKEKPTSQELEQASFAEVLVKHLKSNAIAIVKEYQLIGSGMGQPSRIDAVRIAIEKAQRYGFSCEGAVLASDAFFPFADAVEAAHKAGIRTILQPGGSIRDKESIAYCDEHGLKMIFTGFRHFKH